MTKIEKDIIEEIKNLMINLAEHTKDGKLYKNTVDISYDRSTQVIRLLNILLENSSENK